MGPVAIPEVEHFCYDIYILEQLRSLIRDLIGNHGIPYLHPVDKAMAYQEAQILLYLGIAHISAVHNLRLASAIFTNPQHIGYYLDVGPALVHYPTLRDYRPATILPRGCWDLSIEHSSSLLDQLEFNGSWPAIDRP